MNESRGTTLAAIPESSKSSPHGSLGPLTFPHTFDFDRIDAELKPRH